MFRVYLKFNPQQVNRGRRSGMGVWRVAACVESVIEDPIYTEDDYLTVRATREYREGVIVNPKALVLDYARSQRHAQ